MSKGQKKKQKISQSPSNSNQKLPLDKIRIDKWLWAARFFKTRSLATTQVDGGKVKCNDDRVKPSHLVQEGDKLLITKGWDDITVYIKGLAERRGSAAVAQTLYEETKESLEKRQERAANRALIKDPSREIKARPTKRDRRELENYRWKSSS